MPYKRLLIVEDNAQMRRMLHSLVADLVDTVTECADGSEALVLYARHRPEWVLMDVQMKEMDGISATRQITAAYPEAHVLIVSNYDDPDLRAAACAAGACGYIVKEDLLDLRRVLLGRLAH